MTDACAPLSARRTAALALLAAACGHAAARLGERWELDPGIKQRALPGPGHQPPVQRPKRVSVGLGFSLVEWQ